jgi:hypothetical protein
MSRLAYCHFCDDIRIEIGNKTSLMGIYGGELLVPAIPTMLPKLAVVTFVRTPVDKPLRTLAFEVREGSTVLVRHEIPAEELEAGHRSMSSRNLGEDRPKSLSIGANAFLQPFVVERPKVIAAVVICDGEELSAGKLFIRLMDQPETAPAA